MRIVIIADFAVATGGAQRVAVESAVALAKAGAQVTFLHGVAGADERLEAAGVETICADLTDIWSLNALAAARKGVWNAEAKQRALDALRAFPARETIVHIHQWTRAFSPSVFAAAQESRLPTVVTAHDYFLACPNGVFFHFGRLQPCDLTPMSLGCVTSSCDARSYPHKLVRLARQAATDRCWNDWALDVIHIADRARDRLVPHLPTNWRHHRIENPIAALKAAPVAIPQGAAFAMVGRLTEDKGALVAARAAAQAGASMIFIGEGPAAERIKAELPSAEITGWLSPLDVETILRTKVRAVLAPSLWPETGPLTVREAAAIGLPAIASKRCGAAEHVADGAGLTADPTPDAFATAMRALLDDDRARAMGATAYDAFWRDPPTPDAHAQALLRLYSDILAR